jgi:type IV pilus assembly protein PilQ
MNQLGKVSEGDIIRIATLETLKKEETNSRALLIAAQKAEEEKTSVEQLITEYIAVNYSNAKNEIMPHLEKILTKERGSISVDERSNVVIISDVADKIRQAKEIVKRLDMVTPQVIIEARIVEASTNFSREIGTSWSADGGIQETDTRAGIGPQRGFNTLGGTYGWDAAVNLPGSLTDTGGTIGFSFTRIAGTPLLLNAKLLAMESIKKQRSNRASNIPILKEMSLVWQP